MRYGSLAALLFVSVLLGACTGKSILRLALTDPEGRRTVEIQGTQLVTNTELTPREAAKYRPGTANVLVVSILTRGRMVNDSIITEFFVDESLRLNLFCQLPTELEPVVQTLTSETSVIQVLGLYDIPAEAKLYFPVSGTLAIDSLRSSDLYLTIDAVFENSLGAQYTLDGRFRARYR